MQIADTFKRHLGWCPNAPSMRTAPAVLLVLPETLRNNQPEGSGSAGSSGRVRQGISIAAGSIRAMARNRYLLWFSLLSGLIMLQLIGTEVWDVRHVDGARQFLVTLPLGASVMVFDTRIFLAELCCLSCFNLLLAGLVMHRDGSTPLTIREGFAAIDAHAGALAALSIAMAVVATILVEIVSGTTLYIEIAGGILVAVFRLPYAYVLDEIPSMLYIGSEMIFITIILSLVALCLVPLIMREEKGLSALTESISFIRGTWREMLGCILVYGTIILGAAAVALVIGQLPGQLYDLGVHSMSFGHLLMVVTCYGFILACWCLVVVCFSAAGAVITDLSRIGKSGPGSGGPQGRSEVPA
jgi:hypothetical protein